MDKVLTPIAWMGAAFLGLFALWIACRVIFKAYYKSKMEYHQELKKGEQKDADTERDGRTAAD